MAIALSDPDLEVLEVPSTLFGPLRVPADTCVHFPDGLLGYAAQERFVLLPAAPEGVYWLQSCDEGSLAFLLVDPFAFIPEYAVDLPDDHAVAVGSDAPGDVVVLGIVTLPRAPGELSTVNLQGPLCVNLRTRTGCQRVSETSAYGTRHPIALEQFLRRGSSSRPTRR